MKRARPIRGGVSVVLVLALAGASCELVAGVQDPLPAECEPGSKVECYTGAAGTQDVGVCQGGTQTCKEDASGFGPCEGEVTPGTEDCANDLDDDCSGLACAQGLWSRQLPVTGGLEAIAADPVVVDAEGSTYLLGGFDASVSFGAGIDVQSDATGSGQYLVKLLADGTPAWARQYGNSHQKAAATTLLLDSEGSVVVAGAIDNGTVDFGTGEMGAEGAYVAKIDVNGDTVWARFLAKSTPTMTASAAVDPLTNDVMLVGSFSGTASFGPGMDLSSPQGTDVYVVRISADGSVLSAKSFGDKAGEPALDQSAFAGAVDTSGNLFIVGRYAGTFDLGVPLDPAIGEDDLFIAKIDKSGSAVWAHSMTTPDTAFGTIDGFALDSGGNPYVSGTFAGAVRIGDYQKDSGDPSTYAMFLAKLDTVGAHKWSKIATIVQPLIGKQISLRRLSVDHSQNVVITGTFIDALDFADFKLQGAGDLDVFVVKLASDGAGIWSRSYGDSSAFQSGMSIATDPVRDTVIVTGVNDGTLNFGNGPISATSLGPFIAAIAP